MDIALNNKWQVFLHKLKLFLNKLKSFFSKPQNTILVLFGLVCTFTTVAPLIALIADTFTIHPGAMDQYLTGKDSGFTLVNYSDLFFGQNAQKNLWVPLGNTLLLAVFSCVFAILYGGFFAFLNTRTNMRFKKYLSAIFIFPYIMPQWTLAMVWKNLFNSNAVTGGSDGLFASLFNIRMPLFWCQGLFPSIITLGLHYSAFAYILIGGIFKNMDANLEEAATILNTPKHKIMFRITIPMIKPAILSSVLLIFGSSMGSYPVPHYLNLSTLSTRYLELTDKFNGENSVVAVIMMVLGIAVLVVNQYSLKSRKNYTTVTGKSGQLSKINLGKAGQWIVGGVFILLTFFTSIYPLISFAIETFLPNPGDYSFLKYWDAQYLTGKWWANNNALEEMGMYGQKGILFNATIWKAFGGTMLVSVITALVSGICGTLIGYAVSKNRKGKLANYVNSMAFIPYLMPSIAVGIAFFKLLPGMWNTLALLVFVGTVKYTPFSSRSSLNSMMQLSNEIEESAIIQNIPWYKRMLRIVIPIQKQSIMSGFLLPFITCIRELSLFIVLCSQDMLMSTITNYFDEMGLSAFSSGINLILIVTVLLSNFLINKITGASIDDGIGG